MSSTVFHPEAGAEMSAAAVWYETKQAGLGKRFLTEVQAALNRIAFDPALFPFLESDVRRCLVRTFPFGVLFRIKGDAILVVAIMHLHREPHYWTNRMPG